MTPFATITLTSHGLELRCPEGPSTDRPLAKNDLPRLQGWATRYLESVAKEGASDTVLELGEEMRAWLDGADSFLTRAVESAEAPLLVEFVISRGDSEKELAKAFLDAPWELLAEDGEFWALQPAKAFCPVRRIGKAGTPPKPSPNRLGLVFMAAAPRGADNLDYEAEEASILKATSSLGLDFAVEESGTLDLLSALLAREKPDAVQISCHGILEPKPGLLLEDEVGEHHFVEAGKLVTKLAARHPRLLFLSACETAKSDPILPSLARSLVLAGAPAVLGWAAPVLDHEATLFASLLYDHLAKGEDLAHALAYARMELTQEESLQLDGSRNWHLARLFLSPKGGGALATAGGVHRHLDHGKAVKTFLDAKGKQVPVAGAEEFVGRRREIQAVLREFRAPANQRHAGVFIHGVGRQGKSSLASRVAHRLEHSHETVVVFGRYDAPFILRRLAERLGTAAVHDIVNRHLPLVEGDKANLLPALTELLEGPCAQTGDDDTKAVLLVIDDFEQALEAPLASGGGESRGEGALHRLKAEYYESIRALLLAFQHASTHSLLLFTSRLRFTCPHDGRDLADTDHLLDVPLHGMNEKESLKQAQAKLRVQTAARTPAATLAALVPRLGGIIKNAQGNPGLQDLLFGLAMDDPGACDRCLAEMEQFLKSGTLPTEDKVRAFLENLALESLIKLLTSGQRELLRAATLFELPVPVAVMAQVAAYARSADSDPQAAGKAGTTGSSRGSAECNSAIQQTGSLRYEEDIARLLALGLLEVYEDLQDAQTQALALNALVRPLAGTLNETEQAALAAVVSGPLFELWGGEEGGKQRGWLQDHELTRLGLLARDARVLAATGADALRFLENQFQYQRAAAWAKEIMAVLDAAEAPASVDLLRTAAERCQQVGDVQEARCFRERALAGSEKEAVGESFDRLATVVDHARNLVAEGKPDEALVLFEQVRDVLPDGKNRAVALGDIARIRAAKGEVDEALQLHQEMLAIFEGLGDKRSRAVTLGDIARIRAAKGEVDEALQLHQERLAIFEGLGDKRSRAVTLGDIARIRAAKGEVDEALQLHQERLAIFEGLGDKRERALALADTAQLLVPKGEVDEALKRFEEARSVFIELREKRSQAGALGDIARIRAAKGEVDEALQLHQEMLAIFEGLGDKQSRAVTLGDIARIRAAKGEVDEALQLHHEELVIYEGLGDKRSRAVTLGDIARIRAAKGEVDEALQLHHEELVIYEGLGDKRSRAVTLGDIANIHAARGEVDRAIELHEEELRTYEALGDIDSKAATLWEISQIEVKHQKWQEAYNHLAESYAINLKLGRLDGICYVGLNLGQLLCMAGDREQGLAILTRSREGFLKLGQQQMAAQTEALIQRFSQDPPSSG